MNIVKPDDTDSIGPDIMYNEFEMRCPNRKMANQKA